MTAENQDFSAKLKELEAITAWFESEEVDLNAALAKFERGMLLADELRHELGQIENRVEKIKAKFDLPATTAATGDEDSDTASEPGSDEPTLF